MARTTVLLLAALGALQIAAPAKADPVDYNQHVAPLLRKYCGACHNEQDREGGLSLQSFATMQRGGENGAALVPGNPGASRMIRVLNGEEPAMPPEDNPAPSEAEIELLTRWVDEGARGPDGAEPALTLQTPAIAPPPSLVKPVTCLDWSPRGLLAVGRFGQVELRPASSDQDSSPTVTLKGLPGKVTSVRFSGDGSQLVTASGTTGLGGRIGLWNVADGSLLKEFRGHYDTVHVAALSPDGSLLASGSYDRRVILWDVASGEQLRVLEGHNGAIYDLDFSADGSVLATASGDETVKLWRVADGLRLDTLSQPLKEQYTVRFSPDDKLVVAGGADNRIRVWRFVSRDKPRINPLRHARFAHEGAVSHLRFIDDGRRLVSVAEDRTIKLWDTRDYSQSHLFPQQPDVVGAVAAAPSGERIAVGRLDGSLEMLTAPTTPVDDPAPLPPTPPAPRETPADSIRQVAEQEPNDDPQQAQAIEAPAVVQGAIDGPRGDDDLFRFTARAGERWMLEVKAARDKSKLDSRIEVLDADGKPVQRLILQAVRDAYFTFRGKDSDTSNDFRVHNWQEMELNEYLYCNGEVVKLWLYPRGPDSGFIVYPGFGKRHTYFGTSPMAHALHEPCYVVQPHPVGTELIPNGLPAFPLYYENDDDPLRAWGADSRLDFTAPADGDYLVRISDIRRESGPEYKYELTVRPRRPDFRVKLSGANPTINAGGGKEFSLQAERIDGFDGPIEVTVDNLPPGFHCPSPVMIESGQLEAKGVIMADADAETPTAEQSKAAQLQARATIDGRQVERDVNSLGEIKLAGKAKIRVRIRQTTGQPQTLEPPLETPETPPVVLVIAPGETIAAEVVAERNGYNGRISFGNHDAGRNLPHGVFVDNIGLNGLMIVDGQTRREFFITAAPFVPEQTRVFHLRTGEEGNQTTQPVVLHVRRK